MPIWTLSLCLLLCQGGQEEEDPSVASPMRQALDRLANRAWSNRKGLPEPALDRSTSSPMLSPRARSQAFLDPPSPAVIPSAANRHHASAVQNSNRNNATASNRQGAMTGNRRDSATSRDMTGMHSFTSLLPACHQMVQQLAMSLFPAYNTAIGSLSAKALSLRSLFAGFQLSKCHTLVHAKHKGLWLA